MSQRIKYDLHTIFVYPIYPVYPEIQDFPYSEEIRVHPAEFDPWFGVISGYVSKLEKKTAEPLEIVSRGFPRVQKPAKREVRSKVSM